MRIVWVLLLTVLLTAGCRSTSTATEPPLAVSGPMMTIVATDGAVVHRGPSAFYARPSSTAGHTEWVVNLPGTGEMLIDAQQRRCRLVTTVAVTDLRVWQSVACTIELRDAGTRLCLQQQRMTGSSTVVVDGCADRNELRLSGIEERGALGVGPRAQTERCAELPSVAHNENYLRLQKLEVEGNLEPLLGARFRHDGDAFSLCFLAPLQRAHGAWRAEVWAESPTAGPSVLQLGGDLFEL